MKVNIIHMHIVCRTVETHLILARQFRRKLNNNLTFYVLYDFRYILFARIVLANKFDFRFILMLDGSTSTTRFVQ